MKVTVSNKTRDLITTGTGKTLLQECTISNIMPSLAQDDNIVSHFHTSLMATSNEMSVKQIIIGRGKVP